MIVNMRLQGPSNLSGRIKGTLWGVKNWLTYAQPLAFPWECVFGSVQPRRLLLRMDRLLWTWWPRLPCKLQLSKETLGTWLDTNEQCKCLFHGRTLINTFLSILTCFFFSYKAHSPSPLPSVSCRVLFSLLFFVFGLDPPTACQWLHF